jgi:phosphatidylglycerophosphatase A
VGGGDVLRCGLLKPGPGTYGSVAAMLLWVGAAHSGIRGGRAGGGDGAGRAGGDADRDPAATIVRARVGREDPGFVVIDEVAGQWIALIAVRPDWPHAVLALLLFRLFDIWKPWPIRRLEQLPEGTASCWTMSARGCWRSALRAGGAGQGWV